MLCLVQSDYGVSWWTFKPSATVHALAAFSSDSSNYNEILHMHNTSFRTGKSFDWCNATRLLLRVI